MILNTDFEVWARPESELHFNKELLKKNAHAKRSPYRLFPSNLSVPLRIRPYAFDSVLRIYPDGLEVGTVRGEYARHMVWSRFLYFFMFSWSIFFVFFLVESLRMGFFLPAAIMLLISYSFLCYGMMVRRGVLYQPVDDPVLFNRKNKMVYIRPYIAGGFFDFWKRGEHGSPVAYRWNDQIRARVYKYIHHRGGGVVSEGFELALLCIRDGTSSEVERLISIGTQANGSDVGQLALWEHIRQYMEERGPAIQPGDRLRATDLSRVPEFPPEILAQAGRSVPSDE